MNELIYEQPLNEKTRSYLRLEYLANQLQSNLDQDHQHRCFYPLFSLCELTERCDYRTEIIKDIDKQLITLKKWQDLPHIDEAQVNEYIERLQQARTQLVGCERPGQKLKQDRFLSALRQRFGMPGACCNFDLPQLHYWLAKPWAIRQQEYQSWIANFQCLLTPIKLLLELTRKTTSYNPATAVAGFYQGSSNQALSLIRVKLDAKQGCYPTISGNRNRYAIHFVLFDQQKHSDQTIDFMLATCG
ncbi:cell division protein ZapD [Shewanella colwelliana]|uniref:Cell division protein ZapD n=1 Tax=Shewanella colwelliana TaxID=23 RepID=A0A1E5IWX6_SHECO|nr:cell division protein ZapD [Shewanella colwelliana]MDX1282650.1 cell division protein ZapD [Shewanella colwelliana]OEG75061.1 cell division protein ZapD [Shewanella colwelliana]GIU46444.1 cell division protein ZapD [Shewanella colwelliana]